MTCMSLILGASASLRETFLCASASLREIAQGTGQFIAVKKSNNRRIFAVFISYIYRIRKSGDGKIHL
jgi:hypothetical protein